MKLFFRLGKNANLAYAELLGYFATHHIEFSIEMSTPDYALMNIHNEEIITTEWFQSTLNALGGTIKIGVIVGTIPYKNTIELKSLVLSRIEKNEGKKVFGFSLIGITPQQMGLQDVKNLGMDIKKELGSARFVTSQEKELSSVIVKNEKLLTKGGEFILAPYMDKKSLLVVQTRAVQDFKGYEKRDFKRPRFDDVSGMLPPKVAQMMINIAKIPSKDTLVMDPFCGSGTLLQELLLQGYTKVAGSDISEKAIDDTQANLEWLSQEYGISLDDVSLYNIDAKELAQHVKDVGAIITEPYLGPALKGHEKKEVLVRTARKLEDLYMRVFKTYAKILKKNARVVTVVPAFRFKNEIIYLDIFNKLQSYGFVLQTGYKNLVDKNLRYPLTYYRPDAKVIREIMVFEYKG